MEYKEAVSCHLRLAFKVTFLVGVTWLKLLCFGCITDSESTQFFVLVTQLVGQ